MILLVLIPLLLGLRGLQDETYFTKIKAVVLKWLDLEKKVKKNYKDDLKEPFQELYLGDNFDKVVARVRKLIDDEDLESYNKGRLEREVEYAELDAEIKTKEVFYNLVKLFPQKNNEKFFYYKLNKLPKKSDIIVVNFFVEVNKHDVEILEKVEYILRSRKILEVLQGLEKEHGKFKYSKKFPNGVESIVWEKYITEINRPRVRITLKSESLRLKITYENK